MQYRSTVYCKSYTLYCTALSAYSTILYILLLLYCNCIPHIFIRCTHRHTTNSVAYPNNSLSKRTGFYSGALYTDIFARYLIAQIIGVMPYDRSFAHNRSIPLYFLFVVKYITKD